MGLFDKTPALLPRWAITALGVSASGVDTPTSQKRDAGWLAGEKPARTLTNWLAQTNYIWTGFFEAMFQRLFDQDFIQRRGGTLDGAATLTRVGGGAPYQWRYDVQAMVIWSGGKAYEIDAASITITTAGSPTRNCLLVATPSGLAVRYSEYLVDGDPVLVAGDVPLYFVILGTATTSATPVDRRDLGRISLGRLAVARVARMGERTDGSALLEVARETDSIEMRGQITAGFQGVGDYNLTVDQAGDSVSLKGRVYVDVPVRRTLKLATAFVVPPGSTTGISFSAGGLQTTTGHTPTTFYASLDEIPDGATITRLDVWMFVGSGPPTGGGIVNLERVQLTGSSATGTAMASVEISGNGNLTDNDSSVLTPVVDKQNYGYRLAYESDAARQVSLLYVAVTWRPSEL